MNHQRQDSGQWKATEAALHKEETSSLTVSTDALMLSLLIDATKRRDLVITDVTGAYLHAEMEDFPLLKMEGESVDIMCGVCEDYRKYGCHKNGKKVLYLTLLVKVFVWLRSVGTTLVRTFLHHPKGSGLLTQPIRHMCGQQDH
jgi:hypothetical protein